MPDERFAGGQPGKDTTREATRPAEESPVWRPFTTPRRLGRVGSTNSLLVEEAQRGAPEGTVIWAESQFAGRGRLGRRWLDPPGGSLLCSLLFRPPLPPEEWFLVVSLVSLAARSAVAEITGVETACKWPNDLVSSPGGLKVAGVLAEAVSEPGGLRPSSLVVGIGLNCSWPAGFPPSGPEGEQIAARASSLDRLAGHPVEKELVGSAFLAEVARRWTGLAGDGREPERAKEALLEEYRGASATIGSQVRVELASGPIEGRALAVRDDGSLLLATTKGERAISAGDVVHLRPRGQFGPG